MIKLALRSVQGLTFVIAAVGAGSVQHPLELGSDNTTEQRQVPDVELAFPLGLGIGPDGSLYVSERQGHRVRRIDLEAGTVTTVAGTADPGFSGDGGPASRISAPLPHGARAGRETQTARNRPRPRRNDGVPSVNVTTNEPCDSERLCSHASCLRVINVRCRIGAGVAKLVNAATSQVVG